MTLQIVGAGLGRTGTASVKVALEQLGIGRCYHMGEVIANLEWMDLWIRAADGAPDWEQTLDGFSATADYPACSFWRELADYYPSAKVLLSVRDADRWFESTQETIFSPSILEWAKETPMKEFMEKTVWQEFDGRIHDRDFMVPYFERRVQKIREAIPADRLLVYEVKQGWGPLCEFLDLPLPDAPFPRVNSRDETRQLIESIVAGKPDQSLEDQLKDASAELFGEHS